MSRPPGRLLRLGAGLGLVALLLAHVVGALELPALRRLEVAGYDLRLRWLPPTRPPAPITIIDIDERSLAAEGQWPWPRDRLARLVDRLYREQGAAVIGFDVLFAEADRSSGLASLQALAAGELRDSPGFAEAVARLAPALDQDARFAAALARGPSVLGYPFQLPGPFAQPGARGQLPPPALPLAELGEAATALPAAIGYSANLPPLQQAARDAGHFSYLPDVDGLTRRVPLLIRHQDGAYPALALAVARAALGSPPLQAGLVQAGGYRSLEWLELAGRAIPLDAGGAVLVPFRGPAGSYPYVSASEVLQGRLPPGQLRGHVLLLGTTAPGLLDQRNTPVGNAYPGVEVHANLVDAILAGQLLQRPAYVLGYEVLLVLLLGGALALLLPFASPLAALLLGLGSAALVAGASAWAWLALGLVLPLAPALAGITLLFLGNALYALFAEAGARRRVAALFGQYVPAEVVRQLSANPALASMEGEAREMSVLFCDVQGFTTLAEELPPPRLTAMMNALFSALTRVIQEHGGTIDKYMGDAVMAFWGAPLPDPAHARHALAAALALQQEAERLRQDFTARGWPPLQLGIGVNSGQVVVGNMGSEFRRAYTVLGDPVNLAARLEAQTRHYGLPILIGDATRSACPEHPCIALGPIRVKGKQQAVTIHLPLPDASPAARHSAALADAFHQALQAGEYTAADQALQALTREARLPAGALQALRALTPPAPPAGAASPANSPPPGQDIRG